MNSALSTPIHEFHDLVELKIIELEIRPGQPLEAKRRSLSALEKEDLSQDQRALLSCYYMNI